MSQEGPSVQSIQPSNLTFQNQDIYFSKVRLDGWMDCTGAVYPTIQPDLLKIYIPILEVHRCSSSNLDFCICLRKDPRCCTSAVYPTIQPDLLKKYIPILEVHRCSSSNLDFCICLRKDPRCCTGAVHPTIQPDLLKGQVGWLDR